MASVYDYGIGNLNNTMLNFMQQQTMDKYRQFQENVGMAKEERDKQKFAWEQKKQAEMDAPADATAFMNSQGLHPEEQKPIKDFILSMGYGQDINGRLILNHKRDVPVILKQIANQPQLNLAIDIARDNRYGNTLATMQDQMDKIMEKDPIGYPNDEKYMELVNQGNQIAKQRMILSQSITRLKTMIEKGDTSLTEPEILSLPAGNPQREAYIQGKQRVQKEPNKQLVGHTPDGKPVNYNPETGIQTVDGNIYTGRVVPKIEKIVKEDLTPGQTATIAHNIRQELKANPIVRDYQDVGGRFQVMQSALEESKTTKNMVATDQALITLFNKMTDPQSVVRESEYRRTPEDIGLINRIKGKAQKILSGGAGLTQDERNALVSMANKFYNVYQKRYDETVSDYEKLAKQSKIDPNLIGTPYRRKEVQNEGKTVVKQFISPSTGKTKYVYSDGTEEVK